MIIENVEALRIWLTDKLKPICDADPSALAKYVVALLKKEKLVTELQDVCVDQLDVFLGDDTKLFVSKLFDALQTQSYVPSNQLLVQPLKEPQEEVNKEIIPEPSPITQNAKIENDLKPKIDKLEEKKQEVTPKATGEANLVPEPSKNYQQFNLQVDGGRKRHGDFNRHHRHVRRDKDFNNSANDIAQLKRPRNDSEVSGSRGGRPGRSSSPASRRSPRRGSPAGRRYRSRRERRRRSEERKNFRRKGRCRDYEEKGFCMLGDSCPYDHGKDPVIVDDLNLSGMLGLPGLPSHGPPPHGPPPHGPPPHGPPGLPSHGPPLPGPPIPGPPPPGSQLPEVFPNIMPLSGSNMIVNPSVSGIASVGLSLNTGLTLVPGQQRPLPTPSELPQQIPILAQPQPALSVIPIAVKDATEKTENATGAGDVPCSSAGGEAYNPEEPSIDVIDSAKVPVWLNPSQPLNHGDTKEIYDIANAYPPTNITAEEFLRKMYTPSATLMSAPPPLPVHALPDAMKSGSIFNRLSMPRPVFHPNTPKSMPPAASSQSQQTPVANTPRRPFMNQTILEIRKIPKESNTVVKISEYFQRFGNIVNIQVHYESDPQAALVQFANNVEARRAYSSPEAVLGNRFIKLFWHNKTKELTPTSNSHHSNPHQMMPNIHNSAASSFPPESPTNHVNSASELVAEKPKYPTSSQTTYVNPENTPQAVQRKQAEMKKEALKKKLEIQKQRQALLEKQINEQKALIAKLEKNRNIGSVEKGLIMNALKTLTNSIDKSRKELEMQTIANKAKSKQTIQKELLDREIELYNKQFAGEDATDTQHAMSELEKEARSLDNSKTNLVRGRGRGRGRARGRGLPALRGREQTRAVVDNRPRQILVTGYEEMDKDAVVAQFAGIGQIDRVEEKPGSRLILSFHTRRQAEIAASKAAVFKGKKLVLAWYSAVQHSRRLSTSADAPAAKIQRRDSRSLSVSSLLSKEDKDDYDLLNDLDDREADLLLLEEDEEEDEERSWKR